MDFLGGALPNVMFVIGILAIGLGLGIELKLVPLNKEIDKIGRIGAIIVGSILVAGSLYLYLNPAIANRNQADTTLASAAQVPVVAAPATTGQALAIAPSAAAPAASAATSVAPEATAPTVLLSPATLVPTATIGPTTVPATALSSVKVPSVHDMSEEDAQNALKQVGLLARKADRCSGSDQGESKTKKHRVLCQNPAANTAVPVGTTVDYTLR